jgi:hypothetical protein
MWDIRRFCLLDQFPARRRVVIQFQFRDAPRGERSWWLVVEKRVADLCRDDPGHEVTIIVDATVRALTDIWTGDSDPARELRAGTMRLLGSDDDRRALWRWIGRSLFAPTRAKKGPGSS